MKKTYIKAYIGKACTDFYISDGKILIGEYNSIMNYIHNKNYKDYYIEYISKNSIQDLIDYSSIDARIEPGAIIRDSAVIEKDAVVLMGAVINKGAYIGKGTMIDMNAVVGGNAKIGEYCHIGAGSVIAGNIEPYCDKNVIIGNNVFIGANAVIVEGIHIGDYAVIGAGSIVLHDVNPYEVIAGNPGKVIKERDEDTLKKTAINLNLR